MTELFLTSAAVQPAGDLFQERLRAITLDELLRGDLRHVSATSAA